MLSAIAIPRLRSRSFDLMISNFYSLGREIFAAGDLLETAQSIAGVNLISDVLPFGRL